MWMEATQRAACAVLVVLSLVGLARGEGGGALERDTLTDNWFGAGAALEEKGISLSLSLTGIYQRNTRGGLSAHRRMGDLSGSYDLELDVDLGKVLGLEGGRLYAAGEGSFSDGIDGTSVGSLFGVNSDAAGDRTLDIAEAYYEQSLAGGMFQFRIGKMDLKGGFECSGCPVSFDCNAFANQKTTQFLNGALVNNPTIPFPDNGLGVALFVQPISWCYASAGMADAQADARETGLNTAFHKRADFFFIAETGFTPVLPGERQGAYRFGVWYDPQPKDRFSGGTKRDDYGLYLSYDQVLLRESDADDGQGLGAFFRLGWADEKVSAIKTFWSAGAQYQGLLPARDLDVLGFGVAQGRVSSGTGLTASRETAYELYYNARVFGWLSITPSVQYIENPGAVRAVDNAVVAGIRAQLSL